mmetsp:Transcript_13976/g.24728  ORF Transcript_13976/g.24728 Transcript_13976/m.24728 type:complete len:113 (-) Transcript_13976:1886-2224(-)
MEKMAPLRRQSSMERAGTLKSILLSKNNLKSLEKERLEIRDELDKDEQRQTIETSCSPRVIYRPGRHNEETSRRLKETKDNRRRKLVELDGKIAEVEKEIESLKEHLKNDAV